jgi:hypothetical protein
MSTVVVRPIQAPIPITLAPGWPAPREPTPGEEALLAEAVRFHDFSDKQFEKLKGFELFAEEGIVRALSPLRWHLHDQTASLAQKLMGNLRPELTEELVLRIRTETFSAKRAERVREGVPGADLARVAVRTLLSPEWRNQERAEQLADPRRRRQVLFRRFEDLDSVATGLRSHVERTRVEEALRSSFGDEIVAVWGGDKVIRRPGREPSTSSGGGYAELGEDKVGLTEKLYEQFATTAFKDAHGAVTLTRRAIPAATPDGRPFSLHLDVGRQIDVLLGEVLPPAAFPKQFQRWLANLDLLEAKFLRAILLPKSATNAVELGFPWAIVLTTVLRAYIVELVARVMTLAVPSEHSHEDVNGYLGLALWEARAGENARHVSRVGYLVPTPAAAPAQAAPAPEGAEPEPEAGAPPEVPPPPAPPAKDPLLRALERWTPDSFIDAWGGGAVTHHARIGQALREMAKEPALVARERPPPRKGADRVPARSATLAANYGTWPRYPVVEVPGLFREDEGLDLYVGAHLSAQSHVFVAASILAAAVDDLGLPRTWDRKRADSGDAVKLKRPPAPQADAPPAPPKQPTQSLELIAGSYLWGGRKPPHKTHRDGATFDLRFGADCVAWLVDKDAEEIDALLRADPKRNRSYVELQGICLTRAQEGAQTPVASVFRGLVRDLIRRQLERVYAFLPRGVSSTEALAYGEAEKILAGTPHYLATRSAQQIQAGYVAVLLSGPTQVIFGSPVAHLRAMRAIRLGLAGKTLREVPPALQFASDAVKAAEFVFLPHNHQHHWHVQYSDAGGKDADPEPAVSRFANHFPLWSALGVDLAPLGEHLKALELRAADDAEGARVHEERRQLLSQLESYEPDKNGRSRLHDVFMQLSADAPARLLASASANQLSPQLKALVDETQGVLNRLAARQLISKIRAYLEAISSEDLTHAGGKP